MLHCEENVFNTFRTSFETGHSSASFKEIDEHPSYLVSLTTIINLYSLKKHVADCEKKEAIHTKMPML